MCRHWVIEDKDYIDKCKLDIEMSGFKYITSEAFMQQMIAITTSTPLICTEVRDSSTNEAHINFDYNACSQPKILKKFVKTIKAHVIIRSRSFPDASIISNDQSTIGMKAYLDLVVPRLKVHLMEEEKMRHLNLVVKRDMESKMNTVFDRTVDVHHRHYALIACTIYCCRYQTVTCIYLLYAKKRNKIPVFSSVKKKLCTSEAHRVVNNY